MSSIEGTRNPRRLHSSICTSAVVVAIISGTFSLGALFVGSPRAFGLALVICSAGWIVAHFAERLAAHDRVQRRTPVRPTYGFNRPCPYR